MRKAFAYIISLLVSASLYAQADAPVLGQVLPGKIIQMENAILEPLQVRDSVLIADQLFYGFSLNGVEEGTQFSFPVVKDTLMTGIEIVEPWRMDTVKFVKGKKDKPGSLDLRGGLTITSFDEGIYILPPIAVQRLSRDGVLDTLVFEPQKLEVMTMPVDTTTFQPHDIKGQIRYPVTFKELLPWILGVLAAAALIALIVWLIVRYSRRNNPDYIKKDPPHIIALRELDKYRGNKLWAPEKQKLFYSGITDALREYIAARYGISAMEMTTAEIFKDMKQTDAPEDLLAEMKELFERADFVKFAKFTASEEENASALPVAVRFVTSTYQTDVEEETGVQVEEEKEVKDVL